MHERLVLGKPPHVFLHAARMLNLRGPRALGALVNEGERERRVDIREVVQPRDDALRFELDRLQENLRVRHEGDQRPGVLFRLHLRNDVQLLLCRPALKRHRVNLPIARDLDLEPLAHRVHALRADAVRAAGIFVISLPVFAARMQLGQHQFHAGYALLLVDVHRDAAPVVADGNRPVAVDGHVDVRAVPGEEFVHRVIEHLGHTMMQRALVRSADVHARLFPHRFEPFEGTQIIGVIRRFL